MLPSVPSSPVVPGVQRWQVCKEDPDRGGLRVAGQSRPTQASGELAQAARQHRHDPLIEKRLNLKKPNVRGHKGLGHLETLRFNICNTDPLSLGGGKGGSGTEGGSISFFNLCFRARTAWVLEDAFTRKGQG